MPPHLTAEVAHLEIQRITNFLQHHLPPPFKAVVGHSGGIDADVVARLTARALGPGRMKLFTVVQRDLEERYLINARLTAQSLGIPLVEIDLSGLSQPLIEAIAAADHTERFRPQGLLDPARIKASLRTSVFSTYVERGYVVVGTSNRTEHELGFFLPFGDGVWHLGPIAHLYKTQIFDLAHYLGCSDAVITQPPSGGFWRGETDLEDLAFWILKGEPVREDRTWTTREMEIFNRIYSVLSFASLDSILSRLALAPHDETIAAATGMPEDVVAMIRKLVGHTVLSKRRPLHINLSPLRIGESI